MYIEEIVWSRILHQTFCLKCSKTLFKNLFSLHCQKVLALKKGLWFEWFNSVLCLTWVRPVHQWVRSVWVRRSMDWLTHQWSNNHKVEQNSHIFICGCHASLTSIDSGVWPISPGKSATDRSSQHWFNLDWSRHFFKFFVRPWFKPWAQL